MRIDTERLTLRPYDLADHAPYCAMCSDPEVVRYLGGEPLSAEEAWNRILRYTGHWTLLGYGLFAVIEKASGRYVGETGIADYHRGLGPGFDDAGEAAWIFATRVHGRGYAHEAASAAHDWYAAHSGGSRTVCLIHPDNGASRALAAKLGYAAFGETTYRGQPALMLERDPARS